ncbi:hypothetical protein [Streptomyces sp. NPDC055036]
MRPDRFEAFALDLVKNTPDASHVQTLAETGHTKYPRGLAITTAAGVARWQIIGQLAPGERHADADVPVTGEPVPAGPPAHGGSAEAWLAAVLTRAQSPEIASIDRWSTRPGKNKPGITVTFHNRARAFIRQV